MNALRLHPGQQMAFEVREGAELFCAAGALRVRFSGPLPFGPRLLQAGQAVRAPSPGAITIEALAPARCMLHAAVMASPEPPPKENSLRLWGRRLWVAMR